MSSSGRARWRWAGLALARQASRCHRFRRRSSIPNTSRRRSRGRRRCPDRGHGRTVPGRPSAPPRQFEPVEPRPETDQSTQAPSSCMGSNLAPWSPRGRASMTGAPADHAALGAYPPFVANLHERVSLMLSRSPPCAPGRAGSPFVSWVPASATSSSAAAAAPALP